MQVIFTNRAYDAVISEATNRVGSETGGVFLGCYENDTWYVIETIGPGPNAVFQKAYFEYDREYVERQINLVAKKYQAELTLIGNWHKHLGESNRFTPTDDSTNSEYAKLSVNGAISVIVNTTPVFRLISYHVAEPFKYTEINYVVGDDLIPERLLRFE